MRGTLLLSLSLFLGIVSSTSVSSISRRGWNSWDNFLGNSNEADTLAAAEYMQTNLLNYGFNTVTIDEGWYYLNSSVSGASMDNYGRPIPRVDQYPSAANGAGFVNLASQVHAMGLRLGVWTIRGILTAAADLKLPIFNSTYTVDQAITKDKPCSWNQYCSGCADNTDGTACNEAAYDYYRSVAVLYKQWGLDFVKIDCMWSGNGDGEYDHDIVAFTTAFQEMDIEVSLSPGLRVSTLNGTFINDNQLASMYRVTQDFWDSWTDVNGPYGYPTGLRSKLDKAMEFALHFNDNFAVPDLDMLPLGRIFHMAQGPFMYTNLTQDEQRLVITLWSAVGSPLTLGGRLPLEANDTWTLSLLSNADILRVHNESMNRLPIIPVGQTNPNAYTQYAWSSVPLTVYPPQARYISLYNAEDTSTTVTIQLEDPNGKYCATDLWTGARLPQTFSGTFYATLPLHGAGMYVLQTC